MNWLIVPVEELKSFDLNWEDRLKNADGTLVDGKAIIKNIDNQLNKRAVNIETATVDSTDNYITNGVKFMINNPNQGSRTVTITGYEILITGNM